MYAVVELGHNITEHLKTQKVLEKQKDELDYRAHYDALTSLPNRVLFLDRLKHSMQIAKRDNNKVALVFIDLDHFKEINDSLGHDIGDEVLQKVFEKHSVFFVQFPVVQFPGKNSLPELHSYFQVPQRKLHCFLQ